MKLTVESWVEVQANSALEAETEAYKLPNVVSVFGRSAIPGNKIAASPEPMSAGVQEELFG